MTSKLRQSAARTTKASSVRTFEAPKRGILDQLLGYQIRRAQTRLFAHFEEHLHHLKITPGQLGLLVLIVVVPPVLAFMRRDPRDLGL